METNVLFQLKRLRPYMTSSPLSAQDIARVLEEDIVLGRILPRERLPEDILMSRFQAKRHIVRKALVDLANTGVLEHAPNKGAQVRSFTTAEVENLYELRMLLETEAARSLSLPFSPKDVLRLRRAQELHDAAAKASDIAAIFRANLAFHRLLFSFCSNRFLVEAVEAASQRAHGIRFASLRDQTAITRAQSEHYAMIEAGEAGRGEDLTQLCRDHLPPSREAYIAYALTP